MRQRLRNVKGLTWNKGIHAAFYDPGSDFVVLPQLKKKMHPVNVLRDRRVLKICSQTK